MTRRIGFKVETVLLAITLLVLLYFCLNPFLQLFQKVFFSGAEGGASLQPLEDAFALPSTWLAVRNTLLVSSCAALTALLIAVPLAWIVARAQIKGAKKFRTLFSLPFAVPPYIGAIAWIFLANPSTGLLNRVFEPLFGVGVFNIYSFVGLVFVETSFLYALVFVMVVSTLERMDSSLEEAARLSGASPARVFLDINLPLMRPVLLSAFVLVFLAAAASFGVPALIGGPARIFLLTTQIYTFQKLGSTSGLLRAGALSSVLFVFALIGMSVATYFSRRARRGMVGGKATVLSRVGLGRWQGLVIAVLLLFWIVSFALPIFGIVLSSLSRVQGESGFDNLTLETWYRTLFEVSETGRALFNSFFLAAGAATLAGLISVFASYVQVKTRLRGRGLIGILTTLPYATPGTVLAFALILTFQGSFLWVFPSIYNSLLLLMIAYLIKNLSFAVATASDGFRQIDDVLAEAARVSGATWAQTFKTIWLPLLMPSLIAAWFLVFMPSLSELTMSVLLSGPGLETIGTTIFQLQEYADASGGGASVLSVVVIALVLTLNFLLKTISRGRYGL